MELVISTYGTLLSREDDCFVITQSGKKKKVSAREIRSIQLSRGVQLTSDVVMFAIKNEIEILFVSATGQPMGRVWSPKYGSISTIRKGQIAFLQSPDAVAWIKEELAKKINAQQAFLLLLPSRKNKLEMKRTMKTVDRMEDYQKKIEAAEGSSISDIAEKLRGWEGSASRLYFEELNHYLPEAYRFEQRSQHPARDITNALLNYGYGILYGRIEGALIKAGIDPYVGGMHRDEYNRPVLVYDVIEQYRTWVDLVVYNLVTQIEMDESYYSRDAKGACWLENLGRRVLIQAVNDYLEEVVEIEGVERSRNVQIQNYANGLAKRFSSYHNPKELE